MLDNQLLAASLLQTEAVRISPETPFTWASGLRSPIYCDNRILLSFPELRTSIIDYMVKVVKDFESFDTVAGVATAGIPHGALLADRLKLPFIYVRSKPKEHGRQNLIEGKLEAGSKVLVVEDLISTGMSSLQAVQAIQETATVVGVVALFQYGLPIANKAFAEAGVAFKTLTNYPSVIQQAADLQLIRPDHLSFLEAWSNDPKAWSEQYIASQSK